MGEIIDYYRDTKEIRQHWKAHERLERLEAKGSNRTQAENNRLQDTRARIEEYHAKHGDNQC